MALSRAAAGGLAALSSKRNTSIIIIPSASTTAIRLLHHNTSTTTTTTSSSSSISSRGHPQRQHQHQQRQQKALLVPRQARRLFRSTRRNENPILIGVVIIVGATLARYMIRAANRVAKAEAKGEKGDVEDDDDDDDEHEDKDGAAAGGKTSKRGFPVLGLDLGTMQSCVSYVASKTAGPLVVENHEGRRSTPAFVAYEEGSLVVGQLARRARWREPGRVAFNIQRLLGTTAYADSLRPLFPFPIEKGPSPENPLVLNLKGGERPLSPVEVSSRLIEDLVQTAEHKLHQSPKFAVLAVPSYFDQQGKKWALQAAQEGTGLLAGDDGVEVVEDSVAALVCAHYSGAVSQEDAFLGKPWLVVDVGGLNAQFSVVGLDPEHGLGVKRNCTTWGVGGDQLDGVLVWHMVEEFKKKNGGLDLGTDYLALERLYEAAEAAKIELSSKVSSNIRLPFITADHRGPKHLDVTVSRAQFENLAGPLFAQLEGPFQEVLKEAGGLTVEDLQGVLLSGGTTRLPFVSAFVERKLTKGKAKVLSLEVPPEEMAALGAGFFGRELVE